MLIVKSADNGKICKRVTGLEAGKAYSFTFSLKLSENTETRTVGYAGISKVKLDDAHSNVVLPKAYSFYSLGGGSFAYDKETQKGRLAYNGEYGWIDYEVRFVAEQSYIYYYFENSGKAQDMLLDNIQLKEAKPVGSLGIKVKAATDSTINVLLIGNSYSFDATRELMGNHGSDGIINFGCADLRFGCLAAGGQPFTYFKDQIYMGANSMKLKYYAKGDREIQSVDGASFDNAMELLAAHGQKWDYIMLQAATNNEWLSFAEKGSLKNSEFEEYVSLIKSKADGSEVIIYGTWAATNDFNRERSSYTLFEAQEPQHRAIMKSVENINLQTGCRVINMEKIFHTIRSNKELGIGDGLNRDGYHLNGIGSAVVGLAIHRFFTDEGLDTMKWNKLSYGAYGVKGSETELTEEQLCKIKHIVELSFRV